MWTQSGPFLSLQSRLTQKGTKSLANAQVGKYSFNWRLILQKGPSSEENEEYIMTKFRKNWQSKPSVWIYRWNRLGLSHRIRYIFCHPCTFRNGMLLKWNPWISGHADFPTFYEGRLKRRFSILRGRRRRRRYPGGRKTGRILSGRVIPASIRYGRCDRSSEIWKHLLQEAQAHV